MAQDLEVAILFADVVGSTRLYDEFGDTKASETVAHSLEVMKDATFQFRGKVIKTIGDEVLSTFETVDNAMSAAVQMQNRISNAKDDEIPVSIRIGCHYGPVVQERNDIFGAAVHTANRMTSQAKSGQIVVSAATVEHMGPEWHKLARQIDVATVRGRIDEVALYEVLWQPDEATSMLPTIELDNKAGKASKLIVTFGNQSIEVDDRRKNVSLGRSDDNDLIIKGNLISRLHARIEKRRGKFFVVDQSTNGTFIQDKNGKESFLRRDSTEVTGEGYIGLGRAAVQGAPLVVHFVCIE
jgi:class 3 adenylate cyclase